jgi:hypothetical protein
MNNYVPGANSGELAISFKINFWASSTGIRMTFLVGISSPFPGGGADSSITDTLLKPLSDSSCSRFAS